MPKSRVEFWQKKFDANVKRDRDVREELYKRGIKCLVIWECTIKKMRKDQDKYNDYMEIVKMFLVSQNKVLEL